MFRWIAILLVVLLAGCREEVTMLSHDDLAALLDKDRKIEFQRTGFHGTALLNVDESFAVDVPRLGQDTGVWWLEGDKICSKWDQFRQGRHLCAVVGQRPDGTYRGYTPPPRAYLGDFRFLR